MKLKMFSESPNDSPMDGTIHPIALEQLERYKVMASTWFKPYTDGRHNRCSECHQNVWFSTDPHGRAYGYTDDEIQALIIAHIRQVHDEAISKRIGLVFDE